MSWDVNGKPGMEEVVKPETQGSTLLSKSEGGLKQSGGVGFRAE